ncbi:MAG: HIT family protein [Candidatus Woesearchaeota archaeon]
MEQGEMTPEQMAEIAKQQCIFCHIAAGRAAAKKVYEDDKVVAVLDINPANPGHILLITKEHYMVMPQIPEDVIQHIGMVTKSLSHAILKALKAQGTTIFVANGVSAGQRAQHFMLHIIPRMEGDGVGIDIPQFTISDSDYKKIYEALKKGVQKALGKIEGLEEEEKKEEKLIEKAEEKIEKKEEKEKKEAEEKKPEKKKEKEEKKEETGKKEEKKKPKKESGKMDLDQIARLFS